MKTDTESEAPFSSLEQIKPALTRFNFGYVGLRLVEKLTQSDLCEPPRLACLPQASNELDVQGSMGGWHRG